MTPSVHSVEGLEQSWQAQVLPGAPMIAPARQFVFPQAVPGEEDALARGALWVMVMPRIGGSFLAQCALGYAGNGVATGVWPAPQPDHLLAIAGGYAYLIDTTSPDRSTLLEMRPVVSVHASPEANAVALVGFHAALVLSAEGLWTSDKISWEGVTVTGLEDGALQGLGWHMPSDRELPFSLDLRTRALTGGGYAAPSPDRSS